MAAYNEIQVGRYVRFFQKFWSMKGRAPAPLTFAGELGAHIPLFHGVENRYLEGWNRFGANQAFVASPGNANGFQLRNPSGSNVIAVIEKFRVTQSNSALATSVEFRVSNGATTGDFPNAISLLNSRLDPRGNPQPTLLASQNQAAMSSLGNVIEDTNIGPGTTGGPFVDIITTENQELPILPGDALRVITITVNIASSVSVVWRERFLEDSERA